MPTSKPLNDIIRIAENSENLPSTGKANKQLPSYTLRTTGYDDDQFMSAEEINYIFDNLGQWSQYFETRIDELILQIEKERVSIGEIIEITGDATNPSILKGYGTWESFGEGVVLVGVGSHTDDRGESKAWVDGQVEGEYRHVQTEDELAAHTHIADEVPDHVHSKTLSQRGNSTGDTGNYFKAGTVDTQGTIDSSVDAAGGHTPVINNTGNSDPMNNIQPTLAVYRWKRTA